MGMVGRKKKGGGGEYVKVGIDLNKEGWGGGGGV
jgi:hypothetical protein